MFQEDQLYKDILNDKNTSNPFKEGHVDEFAPTYKLRTGNINEGVEVQEIYDLNRLPAWTDRIIFWSNEIKPETVEVYNQHARRKSEIMRNADSDIKSKLNALIRNKFGLGKDEYFNNTNRD